MHEFGIVEGIMEAVERRAAGRGVSGVRVRIGVLHRVAEPALDQAFEMIAAGTVADQAEIELVVVPIRSRCPGCGNEEDVTEVPFACEACGANSLELSGGDEVVLESIRLAPA